MVDPENDLTALGNVARIFAGVSNVQVQDACDYAKTENVRIGDALVAGGALNAKQRDDIIAIQAKLRRGTAPVQIATQMVRYVTQRSLEVGQYLAEAVQHHRDAPSNAGSVREMSKQIVLHTMEAGADPHASMAAMGQALEDIATAHAIPREDLIKVFNDLLEVAGKKTKG